ncbi:MAG: MBL fold metallo-hydrolase [Proteobacteria bacterium]|nr:MBL fold metallo-hydrolase [Pseudomonadota bacterium]
METQEFEVHAIDGYIETIYLAVYPEKILILDSGCKCDAARIESYITGELHRPIESVKLIIASHTHPDHVGAAPVFKRKHTIPIAAPRLINSWYSGFLGNIQHKIDTALTMWVSQLNRQPIKNVYSPRKIEFDFTLSNGQPLPFFNDWTVIETPGHTNHDIVIYNERASVLYAGDVIVKPNDKFILPFPVILTEDMRQSLDKLAGLKVKKLLLAHGGTLQIDSLKDITDELQLLLNQDLTSFSFKIIKYLQMVSPEAKKAKKRGTTAG